MAPRPVHDPEQVQMTFGDHLEDLRRRILKSLVGVLLAALATFFFGKEIIAWICVPLAHAQRYSGVPAQTVTLKVMSGFFIYMKVSMIAALVVASPWVLYQVWQFIAVGLYASERKAVHILGPFSGVMTLLGVAFTYYVLLPMALMFLIYFSTTFPPPAGDSRTLMDNIADLASRTDFSMIGGGHGSASATQPATTKPNTTRPSYIEMLPADPPQPAEGQWWINTTTSELRLLLDGKLRSVMLSTPTQNLPLITLDDYIDFALYLMLAVVICFQLPVLMLVLGWTGIVDPRFLAKGRKYVLFGCFVAAAVITPSGDPFNLSILAAPLYALFELGLLVMRLAYRPRRDEESDSLTG